MFERFSSKVELASSTSRRGLEPIVSELQDIHQETIELEVPDCVKDVQGKLTLFMDTMIDGFLLFMAEEPESEYTEIIELAIEYMGDYYLASLEARISGIPTQIP